MLKPSPIEGVGVFIVRAIKPGTILDLWGNEPTYSRPLEEVQDDPLVMRFGVIWDGLVYFPPRFNRMAIAWYLNHSDLPNVESREDDQIYSLYAIKPGEELTIDYRTLERAIPA